MKQLITVLFIMYMSVPCYPQSDKAAAHQMVLLENKIKQKVQVGMTTSEVKKAIGNPDAVQGGLVSTILDRIFRFWIQKVRGPDH